MDLETYLKQDSAAKYYVKDINFKTKTESGIVFILESPHVKEIDKQKPLMGKTGKEVSKILLNSEIPFGELSDKLGVKIAIINVSNVPLQKIEKKENNTNYNDVIQIKDFEKFRDKDPDKESEFFKNFEKRIKRYINQKNILAVCGEFSNKYFFEVLNKNKGLMKKFLNKDIKVIQLPHPSYQSWSKIIKHYDSLMELKEAFFTLKNAI